MRGGSTKENAERWLDVLIPNEYELAKKVVSSNWYCKISLLF